MRWAHRRRHPSLLIEVQLYLASLIQALLDYLSEIWPVRQFLGTPPRPRIPRPPRPGGTSLLSLPDDLLLEILDHVRAAPYSTWHYRKDDFFTQTTFRHAAARRESTCEPRDHSGYLRTFAGVNRRLRDVARPALFRTLYIGPGWTYTHVRESLAGLKQAAPSLGRFTRAVRIDLCDGCDRHAPPNDADSRAGPRMVGPPPVELFEFLATLERLDTLALSVTALQYRPKIAPVPPQGAKTKSAFDSVSLPQVRTLVLSPTLGWVVPLCPNVEELVRLDWRCDEDIRRSTTVLDGMFVEAAALPKLRYFQPGVASWDSTTLRRICQYFAPPSPSSSLPTHAAFQPHLLRGLAIARSNTSHVFQSGTHDALIATITTCLPQLELLALLDDIRALMRTWLDLQDQHTFYRQPPQLDSCSASLPRDQRPPKRPPVTHRLSDEISGADGRGIRCVSEEPYRAVAFAVLSRLPGLRVLFLGGQHRVRVLERDDPSRSRRIRADIEWRYRWDSWEEVMAESSNPRRFSWKSGGRDRQGAAEIDRCVLGAGYDRAEPDDNFGFEADAAHDDDGSYRRFLRAEVMSIDEDSERAQRRREIDAATLYGEPVEDIEEEERND